MPSTSRVTIPVAIAEAVLFDADLLCCICQRRGHHIHHVDENPKNNSTDNLALLCFDHHHELTSKGGLVRKITPGLLRRYRSEWHRRVKAARGRQDDASLQPEDDPAYRAALDAVASIEVRKLRGRLRAEEWDDISGVLSEVAAIVSAETVNARREAIYCLDDVASTARHRIPPHITSQLVRLAIDFLDLQPASQNLSPSYGRTEQEMFSVAMEVGHSLIHDGDKYLRRIKVVDDGAELLWRILRYARGFAIADLETATLDTFARAMEHRTETALAILAIYREHALNDIRGLPELPSHIEELMIDEDGKAYDER